LGSCSDANDTMNGNGVARKDALWVVLNEKVVIVVVIVVVRHTGAAETCTLVPQQLALVP
jgi:hypothetical protein